MHTSSWHVLTCNGLQALQQKSAVPVHGAPAWSRVRMQRQMRPLTTIRLSSMIYRGSRDGGGSRVSGRMQQSSLADKGFNMRFKGAHSHAACAANRHCILEAETLQAPRLSRAPPPHQQSEAQPATAAVVLNRHAHNRSRNLFVESGCSGSAGRRAACCGASAAQGWAHSGALHADCNIAPCRQTYAQALTMMRHTQSRSAGSGLQQCVM